MTYEQAKERFESFGTFCDDCNEACDSNCEKCSDMEDRIFEALEKQIPKKPITVDDGWRYWDCPTCGARVGSNMDFKYWTCLCGQRIDWSEVE